MKRIIAKQGFDKTTTLHSFRNINCGPQHQAEGRDLLIQEDLSMECRLNCGVMIFRRPSFFFVPGAKLTVE